MVRSLNLKQIQPKGRSSNPHPSQSAAIFSQPDSPSESPPSKRRRSNSDFPSTSKELSSSPKIYSLNKLTLKLWSSFRIFIQDESEPVTAESCSAIMSTIIEWRVKSDKLKMATTEDQCLSAQDADPPVQMHMADEDEGSNHSLSSKTSNDSVFDNQPVSPPSKIVVQEPAKVHVGLNEDNIGPSSSRNPDIGAVKAEPVSPPSEIVVQEPAKIPVGQKEAVEAPPQLPIGRKELKSTNSSTSSTTNSSTSSKSYDSVVLDENRTLRELRELKYKSETNGTSILNTEERLLLSLEFTSYCRDDITTSKAHREVVRKVLNAFPGKFDPLELYNDDDYC